MARRTIFVACGLLLAISALTRSASAADAPSPGFVYVCRDAGAGGYQAFPDVCRLQDGRLMAVFYAGYGHVALPNAQLPKGGRIAYCTSADEGHSWSPAQTLFDSPDDDRDPSIVQLKNGRLICNFFGLRKGSAGGPAYVGLGTWIVISDDLGKTWSAPRRIYDETYYCSSPVRELSSGRLILGLYRENPSAGAVGISDDGGNTWSKVVNIDNAGHQLDAETDVIELADGRLWAAERSSHSPLCCAISTDRGQTWSPSQPLDFIGHSPYLLRVAQSGIILLAYRGYHTLSVSSGNYTALRYSLDECKTWSKPVQVDAFGGAYPSMVNLKDGSVLIVYYEEGPRSSIRAKRFRASRAGIEWLSP